jgi:hypothetical protein
MDWWWGQSLQSGRPAASGGFVELLVDADPVVVELVLLPLMVLLPLLVLGVSLRTCLVTASQHFPAVVVVVVALGVFVVVEVWAEASPTVPANMAGAISAIPVIRMRGILPDCGLVWRARRRDIWATAPRPARSVCCRVTKIGPSQLRPPFERGH